MKLERLYRLWQEMFICYWASEADVIAMFDGRPRPPSHALPRHSVVFFRDRDDYVRSLRAGLPNIDISIGVYLDRLRRAYFFADKQNDDRTLYHEATHQLFHESRPVAPEVGWKANFWIVEGIAMYMESLRQEDGFYVLGGFDDERLHAAQYRLLEDKFYVPLRAVLRLRDGKTSVRPAHRHALQSGGRAGQFSGRLRRRPISRRLGVVSGRRLHRPRRSRHPCQADLGPLQ